MPLESSSGYILPFRHWLIPHRHCPETHSLHPGSPSLSGSHLHSLHAQGFAPLTVPPPCLLTQYLPASFWSLYWLDSLCYRPLKPQCTLTRLSIGSLLSLSSSCLYIIRVQFSIGCSFYLSYVSPPTQPADLPLFGPVGSLPAAPIACIHSIFPLPTMPLVFRLSPLTATLLLATSSVPH